jgi:hypothetical protein
VGPRFVVACAFVLTWGCTAREEVTSCDGKPQARELAGPGAIDCGVVMPRGDRSAVDACVLDAFRRGQAFHAHYEHSGIDSETGRHVVFRDGTYWQLFYDSWPECRECGPHLAARVCSDPMEAEPVPASDGGVDPNTHAPLSCETEPALQTICE